jgi:hypothetical protein
MYKRLEELIVLACANLPSTQTIGGGHPEAEDMVPRRKDFADIEAKYLIFDARRYGV